MPPLRRTSVLLPVLGIAATVPSASAQPASVSLASRAYVHATGSPEFSNQQFTAAAWFRPTGAGENGGGTLISCGGQPGSGSFLCSWWTGWNSTTGRVVAMVVHQFATTARVVTSDAVIAQGQWAHAALTFDGVTVRLYINGVLDSESPFGFTGVDYPASPTLFVGAFQPGTGYTYNRFDGQIDSVAVWGRTLGPAEVAALAACPAPPTEGLIVHVPFTDQSLQDVSGHGHPLTAAGAVAFAAQAPAAGACCDSIDFNGDGLFPDTQDIEDFLSVFAGGPCSTGTCADIDFNNDDLFPDTADIDALLSVFSGGPCL
ncbi:MAG: LamG domain-containing protein [Phycisphaerales bacterium]